MCPSVCVDILSFLLNRCLGVRLLGRIISVCFLRNSLFLPVWEPQCITRGPYHSVQFSRSVMSNSLQSHGLQHARPPCPSPTSRACSNSCPSNQWCHPAISSSVVPFSFCLQCFPTPGSFPMSRFFTSGGEIIGDSSAPASVLAMSSQDWFSLGWTVWISLQSKGLSRVFSNTTV